MTFASNLVWDAGIGFPSGGQIVKAIAEDGWGGGVLICGFVQAWLGWEGRVQQCEMGWKMWTWKGEGAHPRTICSLSWAVNVYFVCLYTLHTAWGPLLFCLAVRSEHGIRYVKLPTASSTSSVLRFLENMCQYLESDSVFSSQPFSPFSNNNNSNTRFYNRTKSGGQNCRNGECVVEGHEGRVGVKWVSGKVYPLPVSG